MVKDKFKVALVGIAMLLKTLTSSPVYADNEKRKPAIVQKATNNLVEVQEDLKEAKRLLKKKSFDQSQEIVNSSLKKLNEIKLKDSNEALRDLELSLYLCLKQILVFDINTGLKLLKEDMRKNNIGYAKMRLENIRDVLEKLLKMPGPNPDGVDKIKEEVKSVRLSNY